MKYFLVGLELKHAETYVKRIFRNNFREIASLLPQVGPKTQVWSTVSRFFFILAPVDVILGFCESDGLFP